MATNEVEAGEMERRFHELLQGVEGGFEVVITQGGMPVVQLAVRPVERMPDRFRAEHDPWYAVIIEQGENGYMATVPDLPGCVAAADDEEVVEGLIRNVIGSHLHALRLEGIEAPEPTTQAVYVKAARRAAA